MPSPKKFARRLERVEKGLLAAQTQPRLPYSSIDGGVLTVNDPITGQPQLYIGQQYDGAVTTISVGGPPLPSPNTPLVTPVSGGLNIYWDGTWVDGSVTRSDFKRVTLHAVLDVDDFDAVDPAQICGEITTATGGEVFASLPPNEFFVFAVGWTDAGKFSVESDVAFGTPLSIIDPALWEAHEQAIADNVASLESLQTVIIPDLAAQQEAAAADLLNLNDVVIPQLQADLDSVGGFDPSAINARLDAAEVAVASRVRVVFNASQPSGLTSSDRVIWYQIPGNAASYWNGTGWAPYFLGANALAADSVTAVKIAADAVTAGKIAADAITAREVAADAIEAVKIKAGAVTTSKMTADSINGDRISTNTLNASKIVAASITGDKVAANAITAREIAIGDWANINSDRYFNLFPTGTRYFGGQAASVTWPIGNGYELPGIPGVGYIFVTGRDHIHDTNFSPAFDCAPGDEFYASVAYRYTQGSDAVDPLRVGLYQRKADGTAISAVSLWYAGQSSTIVPFSDTQVDEPLGNSWFRRSWKIKAASKAQAPDLAKASIWVQLDSPGGPTDSNALITDLVFRRKSAGSLLVDGSILTDHLGANSVTTNKIATNAVTANEISADAITSKHTLTGPTIRTSPLDNRGIKLVGNVMSAYDGNGVARFVANGSTGEVTVIGKLRTNVVDSKRVELGQNFADASAVEFFSGVAGELYPASLFTQVSSGSGSAANAYLALRGPVFTANDSPSFVYIGRTSSGRGTMTLSGQDIDTIGDKFTAGTTMMSGSTKYNAYLVNGGYAATLAVNTGANIPSTGNMSLGQLRILAQTRLMLDSTTDDVVITPASGKSAVVSGPLSVTGKLSVASIDSVFQAATTNHGGGISCYRQGRVVTLNFNAWANYNTSANDIHGTVPPGYRPTGDSYFWVVDGPSGGTCPIFVYADGRVGTVFARPSGASFIGSITFIAALP